MAGRHRRAVVGTRTVLILDGVTHAYGSRPVLDGISLTLPPGAIVGLVGPSGCGKTTLLHIAAGLTAPTGGRVDNGFARPAVVFQEPRLLPWRRALDNIAFGLKARGIATAQRRATARALLARLGLPADAARLFPRQLSGGMRQRVGIGRALAVDPDLLLLDEPFGALDVGLRRELQNLVRGLIDERGLAALFVTHDIAEAVRLSDRILVLSPAPARIVAQFDVGTSFAARDESFLYETAAALLRDRAVAAVFAATP